jgi:hypothetical protein
MRIRFLVFAAALSAQWTSADTATVVAATAARQVGATATAAQTLQEKLAARGVGAMPDLASIAAAASAHANALALQMSDADTSHNKELLEKIHAAQRQADDALTALEEGPKSPDYVELADKASKAFGGVKFSLAMGANGGNLEDAVEDAALVGAVAANPTTGQAEIRPVVRVTKAATSRPRLLLEAHKFPWTRDERLRGTVFNGAKLGFGPFVAIQSSESELLQAFGVGAMVGMRLGPTDSSSLNLGIGRLLDPSVKTLGNGIEDGKPLPVGETAVRFNTQARWSWLILASFTF